MDSARARNDALIAAYDDEAEATGWFGPEVVFGLTYKYVRPGQSLLDVGVGTGLGSALFRKAGLEAHGMDVSPRMLDACRTQGLVTLRQHDLREPPYPYDSQSMDHAVCTGVLNFFSDLSPVFEETARILRKGGLFAFVVGDRSPGETPEIEVGTEHTKSDATVTMYLHDAEQIRDWAETNGFEMVRSLVFTVFMDAERTRSLPAKAYVVRR